MRTAEIWSKLLEEKDTSGHWTMCAGGIFGSALPRVYNHQVKEQRQITGGITMSAGMMGTATAAHLARRGHEYGRSPEKDDYSV